MIMRACARYILISSRFIVHGIPDEFMQIDRMFRERFESISRSGKSKQIVRDKRS